MSTNNFNNINKMSKYTLNDSNNMKQNVNKFLMFWKYKRTQNKSNRKCVGWANNYSHNKQDACGVMDGSWTDGHCDGWADNDDGDWTDGNGLQAVEVGQLVNFCKDLHRWTKSNRECCMEHCSWSNACKNWLQFVFPNP